MTNTQCTAALDKQLAHWSATDAQHKAERAKFEAERAQGMHRCIGDNPAYCAYLDRVRKVERAYR